MKKIENEQNEATGGAAESRRLHNLQWQLYLDTTSQADLK